MALCIRSRRVMLGRGANRRIAPASLEIVGPLITSVDPMDPASYERTRGMRGTAGPEDAVLDLGDHLLTPAFVNVHTHLALAFLRGAETQVRGNLVEDLFFRFEKHLTPDDVRAFSRMGAYESLLHGVGLVWDHYYFGEAIADALVDTGLSGVIAPTLQDLSGPGAGQHESALEATLTISRNTNLRAHAVFAALGPHATDTVSSDLMQRVIRLANDEHLPIHMHVAQSIDELERIHTREGCSPMEWLDRQGALASGAGLVLAHALFANAADLTLLDPGRHLLALCPFSQLLFGFTANVQAWAELGMSWAVATDCAASNDSMNIQKELRLCASLGKAGVTSTQAYRDFFAHGSVPRARAAQRERDEAEQRFAAHATGASLLERVWDRPGSAHPALRAGAIDAGALANLVAWNTDHPAFWPEGDLERSLSFGDTTQAIHSLFVAGKRVGKAGDFQTSLLGCDDYREARLEATERLSHLLARTA